MPCDRLKTAPKALLTSQSNLQSTLLCLAELGFGLAEWCGPHLCPPSLPHSLQSLELLQSRPHSCCICSTFQASESGQNSQEDCTKQEQETGLKDMLVSHMLSIRLLIFISFCRSAILWSGRLRRFVWRRFLNGMDNCFSGELRRGNILFRYSYATLRYSYATLYSFAYAIENSLASWSSSLVP